MEMDRKTTDYLSPAERAALGKSARDRCAREDHATWAPRLRTHTPLDLLTEQELTRVPELVPIRHGRMAASPFAYYRGAALPMAADLAVLPQTPTAGPTLWRCPPGQLRWLRLPRAGTGLRRQ